MVAAGDAFQHYFWGENNAGYDALLTNMKHGVTAAKEFHEILRERANYEEAFSKSLRRLSDKTSAVTAVGTFLPIWEVVKKYIDSMSKIHFDYSSRVKELCSDIGSYKIEATNKAGKLIKEQNVVVKTSAVLGKVRNALDQVDKCKRTYQQRHKELVESEENVGKAAEKELERLQQKHTKCQEAFTLAETNYKSSVEKYNKLQEEYNEDMVESCKYFGTVEQEHLNRIVEFARRYGELETSLSEDLKRNCDNVLGGIIGYTPEVLIELFVEDKKTGVEMVGAMEMEMLTIKDAPIIPKVLEKNSDSGSVNSLPSTAVHNVTTTTTSTTTSAPHNLNTMTLAMSNVSMKAFKKMLKGSRPKKKKQEPDSKSLDSARTGDENGTDDVSEKDSELDSVHGRPHSEIDFFDQKNSPFSSDDEDMLEFGSDEDGTTAKVKTIRIRNPVDNTETTEEDLRKATESLTLRCLSPSTAHRDRSKTYNPQLFSANHSRLKRLTTLNTVYRRRSYHPQNHHISLDSLTSLAGSKHKKTSSIPNLPTLTNGQTADNDDFFGTALWGSQPSIPNVFDRSPRLTVRNASENILVSGHSSSLVDLPVSPEPTIRPFPTTFDTPRAKSVSGNLSSPRTTPRAFPDIEPTISEQQTQSLGVDVVVVTEQNQEEAAANDAWAVFDDRPKRGSEGNVLDGMPPWATPPIQRAPPPSATESLLDLEPMATATVAPSSSSDQRQRDIEELLSITVDEANTSSPSEYMVRETPDGSPTNADSPLERCGEEEDTPVAADVPRKRIGSLIEFSPVRLGQLNDGKKLEDEEEDGVEDETSPVDPLSSTQKSDDESNIVDSGVEVDNQSPSISLSNDIDVEDGKLLSPLSPGKDDKRDRLTIESASTENVEFSSQTCETAEDDRPVYPIAIAVIETVNAVFKPEEECCTKVEGQLIMSLPCDAALTLSTEVQPPSLKLKLSASTPPSAFIVNRQVISSKAPSLCETHEVNMSLLQDFLKKRLMETAGAPRINIPLLKYTCPVSKTQLAPLLTTSFWTHTGADTVLSMNVSVNESLRKQNFYFPRIVYRCSLGEGVTVMSSEPPLTQTGNFITWERQDVGNEIMDEAEPERFQATLGGACDLNPGPPTHVDFEMEGVAMSGLEVELDTSDWYVVTTTVKKIKSGQYWTEPKIVDSNC